MKNLFKILLVLIAFISLSFVSFKNKEINVVIDAGHGGADKGTYDESVSEKFLTESISKKIQELNNDSEIKIHFTRIGDGDLSLKDRADLINSIKPDLVISLHINKNDNPKASGYEFFVSDKSLVYEQSKEMAEKLSTAFSKVSPMNNRGVKTAPYFILKKSECPAILVQMGFLSNEFDKNYVTHESGQMEIAQTILNFISTLKQ